MRDDAPENDGAEIDRIVSLKSAIQIMEKELASYHDFKISHIDLCYRYVNKNIKRNDAEASIRRSPCWVFYINEEQSKEEFILVDCREWKAGLHKELLRKGAEVCCAILCRI